VAEQLPAEPPLSEGMTVTRDNGIDGTLRAAVTGAGSGIGRAVAQRFGAEGYEVAILDRDAPAAQETRAQIPGSSAHAIDVSDSAAVAAFFDDVGQPFRVVIANAGIDVPRSSVADVDDDTWQRVLATNLNGVFYTVRSAARHMLAAGRGGRIIVTASISGLTAEPMAVPYCASKWGVIGLVKAAALELAPRGILVNAVCPGDVATRLLQAEMGEDKFYSGPLGRPAKPEEIAGLYVWLASEDASYMVGETVVIDGGLRDSALMH
jgi:NAD(P)-dependent dehydrogenase (short-subunit alcohol dehydrogenase family)